MDKPNIIIFFAEQHRGDCLSCTGHPVLVTPNIDAIGINGARFVNAYSSCPMCVPARRSLISGQFPATHGALSNIYVEWTVEKTIASVLRDNGYQTAWIGRSMHQTPPRKRFGFEEMVISDHRIDGDYGEFMGRNMPEGCGGYFGSGVMYNDWTARSYHLPEHLHHTNWCIYEVMRFLSRRDPTRPFFLVVSFLAAHPPLTPPVFYMERYLRTGVPDPFIGKWETPPENSDVSNLKCGIDYYVDLKGEALLSARAGYYGLINHMDDQIRRLTNNIIGPAKQKDTVIIFTADHGEMLGDHYLWTKSVPYEGAAKIPLLISAPEKFNLKKGIVIDNPAGLEDIMPTVLDFAGIDVPDSVEGKSLFPLLRGEKCFWRDYIHIEFGDLYHALTDGKEKYIRFLKDGREQYFDLKKDPRELQNLTDDISYSDCIKRWRKILANELKGRREDFTDGKN